MKKCTWKKYTASVLVAAMLAAQPMAVYADEASTASQAAYSDTEAKDNKWCLCETCIRQGSRYAAKVN